MTDQPKYRLHHSLGYQLSVASRMQERRFDEGLRKLGLSRITWCILLAVGNEDLVHPSDIATFVGIDRTAASRSLRQMEEDGMIARRTEDGDRRMTSVSLTPLGYDLIAQATPMAVKNNNAMEHTLTEEERAELRRLLKKIRQDETTPLTRL